MEVIVQDSIVITLRENLISFLQNFSNVSTMEVTVTKMTDTKTTKSSTMEFLNELEELENELIKKLVLQKKEEIRQRKEIR